MRIRAFLALNFSLAVTRRIAEEVERHKAAAGAAAQVAWVPAANLHLTLKFLGGVEEEALEAIRDLLRRRALEHPAFAAAVRGRGVFPTADHPRVLWVGVDGGEPLARLVREVESAFFELGFPREERPYHPHVTVGRVKEARGPLDWQGDVELGSSTLAEMVLYESRTLRSGAEYLARARVPLGAADPPAR